MAISRIENQHQAILNAAMDGFWITDINGNLLEVNDAYCKISGYSREELLGMKIFDLEASEDKQAVESHMKNIVSSLQDRFESKHRKKDGSIIDVEVSVQYREDNGGQCIVFIRDISDKIRVLKNLKKTETEQRLLLNNIKAGVVVHAPDTSILRCNDQATVLLGLSMDQMTGKKAIDPSWHFVNEDERPMKLGDYPVNQVVASRKELSNFIVGISMHSRNRITWVLVNAYPVFSIDNELEHIVVSFIDVSKLKDAERKILEIDEDLKRTQSIAHVGSWKLNANTNEVVWSEELYHMYGFDPSKPPPPYTEHMKLFTEESWNLLSESLENTKKTGTPYELELETVRQDGSTGWMWVHGEVISDAAGNITGLRGAAQDISERKQSESRLKEAYFFLENLNDIAYIADDAGNVIWVNSYTEKITGLPPSEIIGKPFLPLFDEKDHESLIDVYKRTLAGDELENILTFKSGIVCHFTSLPRKNHKDEIIGTFGIARDITEKLKTEKEHNKVLEQLQQSKKMEAVGRLAGGVAHDFNNMLGVILGHAELLIHDSVCGNKGRESLQAIQNAAERSADLTRQLLAFARKQTISPTVMDFNVTVKSMLNMLHRLIGEDIDLTWKPSIDKCYISMDSSQLDQLIVNLCLNARDSIVDIGNIVIETELVEFDENYCAEHNGFHPGDYVLLAISDDGIGMSQEVQDRVFEPFFTTKELGKGTGMGLSTVYGIVKQNNGFINVYSEIDHGTTIKIYLPKVEVDDSIKPRAEKKTEKIQFHKTALVIEDEITILDITTKLLGKLGFKVLSARTPNEAIKIFSEYKEDIHLVVSDVVMPEMNGKELIKKLSEFRKKFKTLFMSGYTANVIAHHGVLDKGVNFIQKPFTRDQLSLKIRDVLESSDE